MELETSGLMIRDAYMVCQDYGQGRDVSCMGYMPLFKAAFELGSVMEWEVRHWALNLRQLWKMRLEAAEGPWCSVGPAPT